MIVATRPDPTVPVSYTHLDVYKRQIHETVHNTSKQPGIKKRKLYILLSQAVVRILSRQPFFHTVRYFFLSFYIFPGNRKTPETLRFRDILRLDTMYLSVLYLYNLRYYAKIIR